MATLKQSTAYTRMFLMVQTADHLSGLTGASPTVNVSKAGGAFGAAGGTVTEVANGFYKIALTTTDTNTLGDLAYHITATSGDATDFVDQVTAQILGDMLTGNTTQLAGQTVTAAAGVTFPTSVASPTNITAASGVALASGQKVDVDTIKTNPVVNAGTVTFPTGATLASTTNITSATGITVATNNDKTGYTASTVSDKTGYSLTQTFPANFSALSIDSGGNVATTSNVKKNSARTGFMFVMTDSTTHAPKTGLIVASTRSIDGGAFASTTNSPTEVATGTYSLDLSAADVNGNHIMLRFTSTGADDLNIEIVTQP